MKRITEKQGEYFFDPEIARQYLREVKNSSMARYMDFLSVLRKLNVKGRYLDVGCGPGVLTKKVALQHPEAELVGIDNSEEMIRLAEQDIDKSLNGRLTYRKGNACNIESMQDLGKFDLIFSTYTLHHWEDAQTAIGNLFSMLNSTGILYIHDLKRVWWLYYLPAGSGFIGSVKASFRPRELGEILKNLKINTFQTRTVFPFFMFALKVNK
jgi:2-polyprenyl-3-methyl-5-hydroxy-6-metoxy-1,4-benzoquinol methylase